MTAAADGEEDRVVFTSAAAAGRQRADVDLGPWSDRIVRLVFRAEPVGKATDAGCVVHAVGVEEPAPPPLVPGERAPAARPPNVVLYVVDTLRADHVGCYGYGRPTTPHIDAFRASAVLYRDAVAQSSWTLAATASILTGLTPRHHGAVSEEVAIRPDVPTLADRLGAAGYRSAAFSTNLLVSREFGHARGFDTFRLYEEHPKRRRAIYLPSGPLVRRVLRWLPRTRPDRPFFLYVHATDPHWPYVPARRFLRRFRTPSADGIAEQRVLDAAWPFFFGNARWGERRSALDDAQVAMLRDLYDGEVRAADDGFGRLLDALAIRRLLDDTVVVLTSDHGEEFQDHGGLAHGQTLFPEVLHVPLLVRLPGAADAGTRVDATVQHVDVFPTVLELAGVAIPPGLDGRSLLGARPVPDDEAYSYLGLMGAAVESVTGPRWKAIRRFGTDEEARRVKAYDRRADAEEHHDVAADMPVVAAYGAQRLDELGTERPPGPEVDERQLERLRALGYTHD